MPYVIKLYYLQRFFSHLVFFWAIDKVFFYERGASPFQISILVALWAFYALIFEVPSGALADRWSRKWILVLSSLFHSLAYLIWIFSGSFTGFLIGYLFRGTGGFLESGTKEALLYDHLKKLRQEDEYEKYTGRLWITTSLAFLLASLTSGAIAAHYGFTFILVLSSISNLIALIFALQLPEAPRYKSTEEVSYLQFIQIAFKKALQHPILLQAIIYSSTVLCAFEVLDEYDQLYVFSVGLPLAAFGVWWAIRMSSEALAGLVAHKFKKYGIERMLTAAALILLLILLLSMFAKTLLILPLLGAAFFIFAVARILNEGRIQNHIDSSERATIASINKMVVEVVAIVGGLGYGFLTQQTNPRFAMLVFVALIGFYFVFMAINYLNSFTSNKL